eukprot:7580291-Pyramimonas_sp.AAC.1
MERAGKKSYSVRFAGCPSRPRTAVVVAVVALVMVMLARTDPGRSGQIRAKAQPQESVGIFENSSGSLGIHSQNTTPRPHFE